MAFVNMEIVKVITNNSILKLKEVADGLLNVRIEMVLIMFSGLLSFLTAGMCYRSTHLYSVRMVAIGNSNSDLISFSCFLLVTLGLTSLFVTLARATHKLNLNFNKFLLSIVLMLFVNFFTALLLSEYKAEVMESVDRGMMEQLKRSVLWRRRNTTSSGSRSFRSSSSYIEVVNAWDTVQIKLSCCGIQSYKDYISLYPEKTRINQAIPASCCSLKNVALFASFEGVKQCYIDASIEVIDSQFLHTQGCHGPIQRWLVHLINKVIYLIYITTCFQGFTVLYLSYLGYKEILSKR